MIFFFLLATWMGILVHRLVKRGDWSPVPDDSYGSNPKNGYPFMIFGIIKAAIGLVSVIAFVISMNLTWLQIALAPKVYLIEYAKSFIVEKK